MKGVTNPPSKKRVTKIEEYKQNLRYNIAIPSGGLKAKTILGIIFANEPKILVIIFTTAESTIII